jgi:hypothetical protein
MFRPPPNGESLFVGEVIIGIPHDITRDIR